jgi:hypothetical protein
MTLERRRCGYCGHDVTSAEVPHLIDGTTFDGWDVITVNGTEINRCAVCAFTLDFSPLDEDESQRDAERQHGYGGGTL